jgi:ketosteroid isomerase-like protein
MFQLLTMRKSIILSGIVLQASLLFGLVSCSDQKLHQTAVAQEPRFDVQGMQKVIKENNRDLITSLLSGDSTGYAAMYSTRAKVLPPGGDAIEGRDNIRSLASRLINLGLNGMSLSTTGIWGDEDLVAEEGTYIWSSNEGKEIDTGKYIVLWRKEEGKWKLFREIWNSGVEE